MLISCNFANEGSTSSNNGRSGSGCDARADAIEVAVAAIEAAASAEFLNQWRFMLKKLQSIALTCLSCSWLTRKGTWLRISGRWVSGPWTSGAWVKGTLTSETGTSETGTSGTAPPFHLKPFFRYAREAFYQSLNKYGCPIKFDWKRSKT